MKTEWLEYLVAFQNYKSIEVVAEFCHTTPQNVGKIFRHLEEEMQCNLFDRSKRRMALTEAGNALAETAAQILSMLQSVKDEYGSLSGNYQLNGNIELIGDNVEILNNILLSFNVQYPNVNVSVQELDMKAALKNIAENPNKIGFIPFSEESYCQEIVQKYDYILNFFPLSTGKSVFLCSNQSAFANKASIKCIDLKNSKFAILSKNTSGDVFVVEMLKKKIMPNITPIVTNSASYFYSNIEKNIFAGITTEQEYRTYNLSNKNKIIAIPILDLAEYKNYLVYHNKKKYSAAEKALVTMIGKYYRNNLSK